MKEGTIDIIVKDRCTAIPLLCGPFENDIVVIWPHKKRGC